MTAVINADELPVAIMAQLGNRLKKFFFFVKFVISSN
jgi:hypothetical protein